MMRHARAAIRNAFFSDGARLFGWRFTFDYLRIALRVARTWGQTTPGEMQLLGFRIPYPNQSHAFALLHEVFVHTPYKMTKITSRPRIIDCGANIGVSVVFFKACAPDASVLAIEALPSTFACLERVVAANRLTHVELVNAAIAGDDGTLTIYSAPGDVGGITTSLNAAWGGSVAQTVPARRLSSFIDGPIDFIKLDVEGAEYDVVDDLAATGRLALVREMAIECHDMGRDQRATLVAQLEMSGMRVVVSDDVRARTSLVRAERVDAR